MIINQENVSKIKFKKMWTRLILLADDATTGMTKLIHDNVSAIQVGAGAGGPSCPPAIASTALRFVTPS